jgi:hypothetical protein
MPAPTLPRTQRPKVRRPRRPRHTAGYHTRWCRCYAGAVANPHRPVFTRLDTGYSSRSSSIRLIRCASLMSAQRMISSTVLLQSTQTPSFNSHVPVHGDVTITIRLVVDRLKGWYPSADRLPRSPRVAATVRCGNPVATGWVV